MVNKILTKLDVFFDQEKGGSSQSKVFKSPYDFTDFAMTESKIPKESREAMKEGVDIVIDLALAHPDIGAFKPEEIFEGSWYAFLEAKMPKKMSKQCQFSSEKSKEIYKYLMTTIME